MARVIAGRWPVVESVSSRGIVFQPDNLRVRLTQDEQGVIHAELSDERLADFWMHIQLGTVQEIQQQTTEE